MVVHLNLRIRLKVVRHEHDGNLNVAQLVYLQTDGSVKSQKTTFIPTYELMCPPNILLNYSTNHLHDSRRRRVSQGPVVFVCLRSGHVVVVDFI